VTRSSRPALPDSPAQLLGQLVVALLGIVVLSFLVVGLLLWWGYWRSVDLDQDDRAQAQGRSARCSCVDDRSAQPGLPEMRDVPRADRGEGRTPAPENPSNDSVDGATSDRNTRTDPVTAPDEYAVPRGGGQTQDYLQNLVFFLAAIPLGTAFWALHRLAQILPVWTHTIRPGNDNGAATPPSTGFSRCARSSETASRR
jgi:hypothetical protein